MIAGPVRKIDVESISSADGKFGGRLGSMNQIQSLIIGENSVNEVIKASENGVIYLDIVQSLVTQIRLLLDFDYLTSRDRSWRGISAILLFVDDSEFHSIYQCEPAKNRGM